MPSKSQAAEERHYSDAEVAKLWGVSATSVRRARYRGALRYVYIGRLARIPASAMAEYLAVHQGGEA